MRDQGKVDRAREVQPVNMARSIFYYLLLCWLAVSPGATGSLSAEAGVKLKLRPVYKLKLDAALQSAEVIVPLPGGVARWLQSAQAVFARRGTFFYLLHPNEPKVSVIDWKQGQEVTVVDFAGVPCQYAQSHYVPLTGLQPFPNGEYVILDYCNAFYVLDGATLRVIANLVDGQRQNGLGLAISPASDRVAVSIWDIEPKKSEVWLFEVPQWEQPRRLAIETHTGMAFSPDGKILAAEFDTGKVDKPDDPAGRRKGIDLYDLESGRLLRRLIAVRPEYAGAPEPPFYFVDGGRHLMVTGMYINRKYGISFWDIETGKLVRTIQDDRSIRPLLAMSPDGQWVAADVRIYKPRGFRNQDYKIWHLATGLVVYESREYLLFSKTGRMRSKYGSTVEFSPDGKYLLEVRPGNPGNITVYEIVVE